MTDANLNESGSESTIILQMKDFVSHSDEAFTNITLRKEVDITVV